MKLGRMQEIENITSFLPKSCCNAYFKTNAEFIKLGLSQKERLIRLDDSARNQMKILENDKSIKELENLNKKLIDTK